MDMYNRIKELCESKELTIAKMCRAAGITPSIIYDLKTGKKVDLNRKTIVKIADALGMTIEEIYGKSDSEETIEAMRSRIAEQNKVLFDLSAKVKPEDIETVRAILERFVME